MQKSWDTLKHTVGTRVTASVSTSGNNQLLAGVAGQKMAVLRGHLKAADAVTIYFADSAGAISEPISLSAGERIEFGADCQPADYWRSDVAGSALHLNLSGNVSVAGAVYFAPWSDA